MAHYPCPRCQSFVNRKSTNTHFGLVGVLLSQAASSFECAKCGVIPKSEFPPEVRGQMMRSSLLMASIALAVFVAAVATLVALN
jgi:hypothetical protein